MKIRDQALFWITTSLLLVAFVWLFRSILLPFVVGITIAYLLNPALRKLSKHSIPRTAAAVLILSGFLVVIATLGVLLLPPLYRELLQLAERAPEYIDIVWNRLQPYVEIVEETVNEDDLNNSLREAFKANISSAFSAGSDIVGGLLDGGRAVFSIATFLIITPLVAFFMMIEWQSIVSWVDEMLPRHSYDKVREIIARIDRKIAGFVRGQVMVAVSLGLLYAISLSIAGLQFGFLIGVAAGLLSVVPLFGSTVGLLVGVGVAWFQYQEITFVLIIAGIFLFGQFLEGNVISPKIMGDSVGLHPLWILFALMAGGTLFGIVGMVLAVPVAASVGVLINFAIEQYKGSEYYE